MELPRPQFQGTCGGDYVPPVHFPMADNYLSAHDTQPKRNDGPRLDIPSPDRTSIARRRRPFRRPSSANVALDRELPCTLVQEKADLRCRPEAHQQGAKTTSEVRGKAGDGRKGSTGMQTPQFCSRPGQSARTLSTIADSGGSSPDRKCAHRVDLQLSSRVWL